MKQNVIYVLCVLSALVICNRVQAQRNTWNSIQTEQLIGHNTKTYDNNKIMRDKQLHLTTSSLLLKKAKDKCKRLVDSLERRLNSVFIIIGDAYIAYQLVDRFREVGKYQAESFKLITKYPYAIGLYLTTEKKVVNDAQNLFNLAEMIVLTYSSVSKMKVSQRKIVYSSILGQMNRLVFRCHVLNTMLEQIQFQDQFKKSQPWNYINRDMDKVDQIIKDWNS